MQRIALAWRVDSRCYTPRPTGRMIGMELLAHYLLFLAKAVTVVVAIGAVVTLIAAAVRQQRHGQQDRL